MTARVTVFDTTLRDGEQSPGCSMTPAEKVRLARHLERLGVDVIEAGFPIASAGEVEAVQAVAAEVRSVKVAALARAREADIVAAGEALCGAARPLIHTFLATSALHLECKLRISAEEALRQAVEGVRLARTLAPEVESTAYFCCAEALQNVAKHAGAGARATVRLRAGPGGQGIVFEVVDDGCGMDAAELELAVERHATSKLPGDDLTHIATLGFRGEALPSIGAVGRLVIASRKAGSDSGWLLAIEGGAKGALQPAALAAGTRVELRDLFYATPARLKFLKAPRTELDHVEDVINRLAMAHPAIAFALSDDGRPVLRLPAAGDLLSDAAGARLARLAQVMGRDFADNALAIDVTREGVRLTGHIGLPTLNRGTAAHQYLFVNGRPVRDRLLQGAVRGAYQDFLARDRELPELERGDLLAVRTAGAYGFVMSSNYNGRRRAAEVLVRGERFAVVRERESYEDLVRGERVPEDLLE